MASALLPVPLCGRTGGGPVGAPSTAVKALCEDVEAAAGNGSGRSGTASSMDIRAGRGGSMRDLRSRVGSRREGHEDGDRAVRIIVLCCGT